MTNLFPNVDHLRNPYREFANKMIKPLEQTLESSNVCFHVVRLIAETGWHGISIPKADGGLGLGHLQQFLSIEELSRVSPAAGAILQSAQLGTAMFLHYGNHDQRKQWLPKLASGEEIASICITEHNSGSHILGMECTAEFAGDSIILNGKKSFIANSHVATVHGVIARTSNGTHKSALSGFIVPADSPGCRPGKQHRTAGLRGFNLGEVIFDNCKIPKENLLGSKGQGVEIAHRSITTAGKPNLAAVAVGTHAKTLDLTVDYVHSRRMYGRPFSQLESVRHRIADIYSTLNTSRAINYLACEQLDTNSQADYWLISGKLTATEYAVKAATDAISLFGARGGITDFKVERCLRDALQTLAPAGTSDVQRKRLADMALS